MAKQTQIKQVTMKDPKEVEVGKRFAEQNHGKREEHAQLVKAQSDTNTTYYGVGAVVAGRVLGIIGYYFYQSKTPKEIPVPQPKETTPIAKENSSQ